MLKNPIFITIAISIWLIATGIIAYNEIRGPSQESVRITAREQTRQTEIRQRTALETLREHHAHERQMTTIQALALSGNSGSAAMAVANHFGTVLLILTVIFMAVLLILWRTIEDLRRDFRKHDRVIRQIGFYDPAGSSLIPKITGKGGYHG